jgi:leader peptidase (prepilin peptidase)/N-methyltransferase
MLEAALAGVFGLLIGSFLNVCIYRFPRDLSVVRPRSFCPDCEKPIAWYDNVPLLSYAFLKGRCRHCGLPIPWRYPVVEALTAILFFSFTAALGPTLPDFKFCLLSALLVGMIFADLEERILPDEFTIGGLVAGLALSWAVPVVSTSGSVAGLFLSVARIPVGPHGASLADSILGAAIPSGFLWLTGVVFQKLRHKEGLGFGDVKMVAAIGAFLGLPNALLTLIAGSALGSVLGILYILIARKDHASYELPFGSFLGAAAILVSLYVEHVVSWYVGLF